MAPDVDCRVMWLQWALQTGGGVWKTDAGLRGWVGKENLDRITGMELDLLPSSVANRLCSQMFS
jgi:hypothetical protein